MYVGVASNSTQLVHAIECVQQNSDEQTTYLVLHEVKQLINIKYSYEEIEVIYLEATFCMPLKCNSKQL